MRQVSKLIPQGQGLAPALLKRATRVELDWDMRQKSRFDATAAQGPPRWACFCDAAAWCVVAT